MKKQTLGLNRLSNISKNQKGGKRSCYVAKLNSVTCWHRAY